MATDSNLLCYSVDPLGIFSNVTNGTANWTGGSEPDGNATIYDNAAGIGGQVLNEGGETASADVYAAGGTSFGSTVRRSGHFVIPLPVRYLKLLLCI